MKMLLIGLMSLGCASAYAQGAVSLKKIQIIKAGCDASSSLGRAGFSIDMSPANPGNCYSHAAQLVLNDPNISEKSLITQMCAKAFYTYPATDWQQRCRAAALDAALD